MSAFVVDTSYITSGSPDSSILKGEIYCCPAVWSELKNTIGENINQYRHFKIQSADFYNFCVCGAIFRDYIEQVDLVLKKGLKVAERGIEDKRDLRNKFREIRAGLLDSVGDLESVILAKQLNLPLLAADNGLKDFARKMGIRVDFAET